jgi:hypothetical protein
MDMSQWLPWKCWVCQGNDFDESNLEVKVPHKKATAAPPDQGSSSASSASPSAEPSKNWMPPVIGVAATAAAPAEREPPQSRSGSGAPSPRDQERARLRELMKSFVNRGMKGVSCHVVKGADGVLSAATYIIDERLQRLSFSPDPSSSEPSSLSHDVHFAQVSEVLRPEDDEARFPSSVLEALNEEQRKKLIMLVYSGGSSESEPNVLFLENSAVDRQRFLTCVRILRRYMDEQGATMI